MQVPHTTSKAKAKPRSRAQKPAQRALEEHAPVKEPPKEEKQPPLKDPPLKTKVNTSGKTSGPHNPAQDEEDLSQVFLSEKPLARFDTHGTVGHVLNEIDRYVPRIFGEEGDKAIASLHRRIRHFAANEKWNYIVVSLSQGMARRELEALLERDLGHEGPLVIDPDVASDNPQTFASETEARVHKDRIAAANEDDGKILLVLYAVNNPDGNKDRELSMRSLQGLTLAIGFFLESDEEFRRKWGLKPMDERLRRQFGWLGLHKTEMLHKVTGLTGNDVTVNGTEETLTNLSATIMGMRGIRDTSSLPVAMAIQRMGIIPSRWANMGIVDSAAEFDRELARQAQEYRAKLTRGWKPPEQRLREEAAKAEQDRQKATAETEDNRRKAAPANRDVRNTAERDVENRQRTAEREVSNREATAKQDQKRLDAEARQNAHGQVWLEDYAARIAELQDFHEAEEKRLAAAMANARTPEERAAIANEIAAARMNYATQAAAVRSYNAQLAQVPESEGAAEGAYQALAATAVVAEQRDALEYASRGGRLPASLEARVEVLQRERPAVDRFPETRQAVERLEQSQTPYIEPREAQPRQPLQAQAAVTAQPPTQPPHVEESTQETYQPLVQTAQVVAATSERTQTLPPDITRPQAEQADPLISRANAAAPGTQTPDARADLLERHGRTDESRHTQLARENQRVEEASRPASLGELDTAERYQQRQERQAETRAEIRENLQEQRQEANRLADTNQAAREDFNRQQETTNQQEQQLADRIEREQDRTMAREEDGRERSERDEQQRQEHSNTQQQTAAAQTQTQEQEPQRPEQRDDQNRSDEQPPENERPGNNMPPPQEITEQQVEQRERQAAVALEQATVQETPLQESTPTETAEAARVVDVERNRELRTQANRAQTAARNAQPGPTPVPEAELPKPTPQG